MFYDRSNDNVQKKGREMNGSIYITRTKRGPTRTEHVASLASKRKAEGGDQ